MIEKVINTIRKYDLIEKDDKIVVGVSGGPDSMALLYLLNEIKEKMNFFIYVAHINHGIRNEEADEDQEYVRNVCLELDLPFYSTKINMDVYARKNKLTSEEAGREIRYSFFNKLLDKIEGNKIAVAHNKNDQAETLLMRLFRGTGIEGLRGMEYKNGRIIRPILGIDREDIEKYCEENNITARIDRTNLEPIYGRNKTRLELIPYIIENYNKGIIDTLFRTSRLMQEDSEFILSIVEEKYKNIVVEEFKNSVELNIDMLNKEHYSIRSRVIRKGIEKINKNLKGVGEKHIVDIINLARENSTGKSINITNNIIVKIRYGNIIIEKDNKAENVLFKYQLEIEKTTYIDELHASIDSYVLPASEVDIKCSTPFIKCFDYDKIKSGLCVRNRREGDRFSPLGMVGSKKLKDFFIDEKIPREERDSILLVEHKDGIIWVVGYRISEEYKLTKNTKRVLLLEYKENK